MELSDWFNGFQNGIARLSPKQRAAFFSECGKNCVMVVRFPFTESSTKMPMEIWMFSFR